MAPPDVFWPPDRVAGRRADRALGHTASQPKYARPAGPCRAARMDPVRARAGVGGARAMVVSHRAAVFHFVVATIFSRRRTPVGTWRTRSAGGEDGAARRVMMGVALAYGAFVYLTLPPEVIAINDDFGYVRSVAETIARGRPWTNAWLEPWSASLSVFSALAFKVTGSLHAATSGALAVFAAVAVAGAMALFRARDVANAAGATLAILLVSVPTLLWKSLEYTGAALYLPCVLWAIWAAEKRRWGLFFLVWSIAIASRQSALIWLALPAWASCSALLEDRRVTAGWIKPALVLPGAAVVFVALSLLMNKTHAQAMITDRLWERLDPRIALTNAGAAAATLFVFIGLGAAVVSARGRIRASTGRQYWKLAAVLSVGALCFWFFRSEADVQLEHDSYQGVWGQAYLTLLLVLAMAGWMRSRVSVRGGPILVAAGSLVLMAIRPAIWDYYLMDVVLFALFAPSEPVTLPDASPGPRSWRGVVWAMPMVLVGIFHLHAAFELKLVFDRSYASCVIAERGLRRGQIDPADLAFAPFGFIGWHLHPYFVANEGQRDRDITGFLKYLRPYPVQLRSSPKFLGREPATELLGDGPDAPAILSSTVMRVGWLWRQRYTLVRKADAERLKAPLQIDRERYHATPFPLNDREWREALQPKGR